MLSVRDADGRRSRRRLVLKCRIRHRRDPGRRASAEARRLIRPPLLKGLALVDIDQQGLLVRKGRDGGHGGGRVLRWTCGGRPREDLVWLETFEGHEQG